MQFEELRRTRERVFKEFTDHFYPPRRSISDVAAIGGPIRASRVESLTVPRVFSEARFESIFAKRYAEIEAERKILLDKLAQLNEEEKARSKRTVRAFIDFKFFPFIEFILFLSIRFLRVKLSVYILLFSTTFFPYFSACGKASP